MKTQKKCKIQKKCNPASYETRGKRKAARISVKEGRNARNNTNKDKRNSHSSGVKDARRGWREAACRQPSWREEWEERKSGRLRTSVLSNLILMRTKADE